MEWQPIETAPKDGTPVLIYGQVQKLAGALGGETIGGLGVARWESYSWEEYEPTGDGLFRQVTKERSSWKPDAMSPYAASANPSHWMPLPEPPQSERTGA